MHRWEQLRRLNLSTGYQPSDLVGLSDLADVFGVQKSTVGMWNRRRIHKDFPVPITVLRATPVYSLGEYLLAWSEWQPPAGHAKAGVLNDRSTKLLNYWNDWLDDHLNKVNKEKAS